MERRLFLFLGLICLVSGFYFAFYYGSLVWLSDQGKVDSVAAERALEFSVLNVGLMFLGGFLIVRGLKKPKVKRKMM